MDSQKKADHVRRDIAGVFAIVLGLVIGLFIRRIKVGLLIGVVLGLIAISLFRKNR
jgi:hypothetical protein